MFIPIVLSVLLAAQARHSGSKSGHDAEFSRSGSIRSSRPLVPAAPPYLENVSLDAVDEYFAIFHGENNTNLTINEQKGLLKTWAQKYGVQNELAAFEANVTAFKTEVDKNVTQILSNLPNLYAQVKAIFENKDQTRQEQHEALQNIKKDNEQTARALFAILGQLRHRGPAGHHGFSGHFSGNFRNRGGNFEHFNGNQPAGRGGGNRHRRQGSDSEQ